MVKVRIEAKWMFDPLTGGVVFFRDQTVEQADLYDSNKAPKPDIVIPRIAYYCLLDYIKDHEKGVVKTDREEDLKIIHRLLDLMGKET